MTLRSIAACILLAGALPAQEQYIQRLVAGGGAPQTPMPGLSASINPSAVAVDKNGNIYFVAGNCVFKLDATNTITRVAGNSQMWSFSGDGGPALEAGLSGPQGLAVDAAGNLYIADTHNARVRRVTPDGTIGTVAGDGGGSPDTPNGDGGPATSAWLESPTEVAVDAGGNLYIADRTPENVRKVDTSGTITTYAGNGGWDQLFSLSCTSSGDGGPAIEATLCAPSGLAVDSAGNLYIACEVGVRKVTPDGDISTAAGANVQYLVCKYEGEGGAATSADLCAANNVAVDSAGNLYISDTSIARVFEVTGGKIHTVAGGGTALGDGGAATNAELQGPLGLAFDAGGNLYIADNLNYRLRKVAAGVITTAAGNGNLSSALGDGGLATSAILNGPTDVKVDTRGDIYIADREDGRVREVTAGMISTIAGGGSTLGDGGPALNAALQSPGYITLDKAGNLYISYISDSGDSRIRKVAAGTISTVAGNGVWGYCCDGGPATSAQIENPQGLTLDAAGNLYFAEFGDSRVREVTSGGTINTIAGNGTNGYTGDGGPAGAAELYGPEDVAFDGNLYIADGINNVVREVTPDGRISTFASAGPQTGGLILSGIAFDTAGSLYVSESGPLTVLEVDANGQVRTVFSTPYMVVKGDVQMGGLALMRWATCLLQTP